jgi:hypothetical protein
METTFLTNRECAAVFWLLVAVAGLINMPSLHSSLKDLLRALIQPLLVALFTWAAAWTSFSVLLLSSLGIWETQNLKTTFIWFGGYAFVTLMTTVQNESKPGYFRMLIKGTIPLTMFLTFFVDAYSFSVLTEVVMLPLIMGVFAMLAIAESSPQFQDEKYDKTKLVLNLVVIIFFFALLYNSVHGAMTKGGLFTSQNFRDMLMPTFLSLLFLPFLYGFMLVLGYERLQGVLPDKKIRRYGVWKTLWAFKFKVSMIDPWRRQLWKMAPILSKEMVDQSIQLTLEANSPVQDAGR